MHNAATNVIDLNAPPFSGRKVTTDSFRLMSDEQQDPVHSLVPKRLEQVL